MKQMKNPVTGKDIPIRERSSKYGSKGQINGLWTKEKVKP